MTVSTTTNVSVQRGNDAADTFSYNFYVLDETDLVVERRVFATGVVDKTYTSPELTISGVGTDSGSVQILAGALASEYEIVITRTVGLQQNLDIVNQGGFFPEVVEEQLDVTTMAIQQIDEKASRGILLQKGEAFTVELPPTAARADKFFAFDGDGEPAASESSDGTGGSLDLALQAAGGAARVGTDDGDDLQTHLTIINRTRPLRPEDFGDVTTPATCHTTLQACIDAAVAASKPVQFDRRYETKRPILARSDVIIEASSPEAMIYNSLTEAERVSAGLNVVHQACMSFGGWHPIFLPKADGAGFGANGGTAVQVITYHVGGAVAAGDLAFTTTTAADAGNYVKGDLVIVRDTLYESQYNVPNTMERPLLCQMNMVAADGNASTGVVKLAYPILKSFSNSLIAHCVDPLHPITGLVSENNVLDEPLRGIHNFRMLGVSLKSDYQNGVAYALALNCELSVPYADCRVPVSINGWHNSKLEFGSVKAIRKVVELAMGASSNRVSIGGGSFTFDPTVGNYPFQIGESSHDNRIDVQGMSFHAPAGAGAVSVVYIPNGNRNTLNIRGGAVTGQWNQLVTILANDPDDDGHNPQQTNFMTSDNEVNFFADTRDAILVRYVSNSNVTTQGAGTYLNDGEMSNRGNVVRGRFDAFTAPTNEAAQVAGWKNRYECHFAQGNITFGASSAKDFSFDLTGAPNLVTYASLGYLYTVDARLNGVSLPIKPYAYSTADTTHTIDFVNPVSEITFTGASFLLNSFSNGNSGGRFKVILINGAGATLVPKINFANFKMAAYLPYFYNNGAVTQATDKSTSVTHDNPVAIITMNNAALAADTAVSFTWNSASIDVGDQLTVAHHSDGTVGSYMVNARVTAAGTAEITVRNVSAGSLSQAIKLKVGVIKNNLPRLDDGERIVLEFEKIPGTSCVRLVGAPVSGV